MTGDFSSLYFDIADNFNGVLYQQGRVSLDADGNAQTRITNAWQDTAGKDIVGASVAAVPADAPDSWRIDTATLTAGAVELTVLPGRVWADGMLVHLQATPPISRTATYLQPPVQDPPADTTTIANGIRDAVILEVWREEINGFQLPERLIEPALGGPDTTERVHTASALRLLRLAPGDTCDNIAAKLDDNFAQKGQLTVTLQPTTVIPGDCPVIEGGGYTGFEHYLYRIEIAAVNSGPTMFKWSQFNGGLVGRGLFDAVTQRVTITASLQAIITSGLDQFYLETREYDAALGHWRVTYGATVTLNNDNELVLPNVATFGAIPAAATPVFFRLWNGLRAIGDFPISANPTELIDGIRLEFEADATGRYVPEDYWTFAMRAGEIANPQVLINAEPPQGIHYHRVPLAILNWDGSPDLSMTEGTIEDCRRVFQPLTRLATCCTYRVGDGIHSHGDFESIQEAINHLPASGGEICVLPGRYTENVLIDGRSSITISGCGTRTQIVSGAPGGNQAAAPVIHVRNAQHIRITHLAIEAHDTGIGIFLESTAGQPAGPLRDISLSDLCVIAATRSAIEARGGAEITIRECVVEMRDQPTTWPAIFFLGDDGCIERNVMRVRPNAASLSAGVPLIAGAGLGGLQLGGTCERVRVAENLIQGGIGNGITLGSISIVDAAGNDSGATVGWVINVDDPCNPCLPGDTRIPDPEPAGDGGTRQVSAGPLYDITLVHNRILDMGLNGIGVVGFFNLEAAEELITVEGLTIANNLIQRCLRRPLAPIEEAMVDRMGYGGIALADVAALVVRENVITDNGPDHLEPINGIFVLHGEGLDLSANRIVNNGAKTVQPPSAAKSGHRGGITILYCTAPTVPVTIAQRDFATQNGVPALRVHDNIVSVPLGRALSVTALGPVSVHANQFTSRGMVLQFRPISPSFIASTVAILNLGVSYELYGGLQLFSGIQSGYTRYGTGPTVSNDTFAFLPEAVDDDRRGRMLASGSVLFSDNQCILDLAETGFSLSVSSIFIITLDDLGFHNNQCHCNLLDDLVLSQAILYGTSLRVSDNRLKEGRYNAVFSAVTLGLVNMTTDNQASHCLLIRPLPPNPLVVNSPNTVLWGAFGSGPSRYCEVLNTIVENFGAVSTVGTISRG
jgi:hypothetical protein